MMVLRGILKRVCGSCSEAPPILTEDGEIDIAVPRDRAGSFEPQLIAKGPDPLRRLRRQDFEPVRARHETAITPLQAAMAAALGHLNDIRKRSGSAPRLRRVRAGNRHGCDQPISAGHPR